MTEVNNVKSDLKPFLKTLLKNEELDHFNYNVVGNSEKGEGYVGDIVFVNVNGTTKNGDLKNYELVLKCSKTSKALREKSPVKQAFLNEIYFYTVVFPSFIQFQKERNVVDPFDKVPKCFGTVSTGDVEMLALENLKSKGYILWDRKKPWTRKHVDLVVKEYGKLHSISIAMAHQEPAKLQELADGLDNIMKRFSETTDMLGAYENTIEEAYHVLSNDFEESSLQEWLKLKQQVRPFFKSVEKSIDGLNVILHGDCWNNNFLHFHTNDEPTTFAILDWQVSVFSSPILDLSYFLFTCLSEEDINDLDTILKYYHASLADHLKKLGGDLEPVYPMNQFLKDWKKYCKYGIILATIIHKFSFSENDEVPDMSQAAEKGEDAAQVFFQPVKNIGGYRNRIKYIVKYVLEQQLL